MKPEEIKKLVAKSENDAVEFKRARGGVPTDFWPSYSSFANTDGGVIILGVREKDGKREIEGLADTEKIVADLWNAVNNPDKVSANVLFNESIYPVDVDGKAVVVVEVPRAERTVRPVFVASDVFKGTYRRNGEGDYHCSREAVEGMIRDKCAETADNCVLDELTIADLDADSIRRYRMYFSQLRPGHVWSSLADDGFLMKIGAAARGRDGNVHPTLAGLVCFGDFNEITNVLPYFFLDYREHLSPDVRWTDRVCSGDANWSGNIFDFFFRINQSITAGVKVPFKIASDNVTRDDDTPVHKALREVLANALIHADYHGRRGIVIDKYPKRLEVSNPGTLRMSKSVAIAGGTSDARNGKIFNIFSLVRIGERSGMGLSSLYGVWEKERFAEPSIVESYEPDRTKVMVEFEADDSELGAKTPEVGVETAELGVENPEVGVETSEVGVKKTEVGVHPDFNVMMGAYRNDFRTNARRVLSALAENPEMDFVRVAQMLNISENSVWRSVRALREVGLLVREGADKGGRWIVKK
ncbi:MAG: putative DNA binding domain-containing protein [Kiritimatiellae bacterium]|nr:putative DNA binding domain-containing protein [Kiritimatiellia bacterium]MBQ3343917.1 putative DNA binding domain-containing protein [Kiritimatiellia bacterium]